MKAVLDTNLIYYWSGSQLSDFSPEKISVELSKFEAITIPSWVIIELLTTSTLTPEQKQKVFQFIVDRKVPNYCTEPSHMVFMPPYPDAIFHSSNSGFIESAREFKRFAEVNILNVVIKSSILVLAEYVSGQSMTEQNKGKLVKNLSALLVGNHAFIDSELTRILLAFYSDDDEAKMKNQLQTLIYTLYFAFSISNNLSRSNRTIIEYMAEVGLDAGIVEAFQENLKFDLFHKRVIQKLNNPESRKKIITDVVLFNSALLKIESDMAELAPSGILKYYMVYIRKILVDSTKLTKNDSIDSSLMFFYPSHLILTGDRRIRSILSEIDARYAGDIETFLAKIRS